jgi:hypothetical protein
MPLSDFLLNLAGTAEQIELRTTVAARIGLETALAGTLTGQAIESLVTGGTEGLVQVPPAIAGTILQLIEKSEHPIGKAVFDSLIAGPLSFNQTLALPEDQAAIATIQKVLGFATELSVGTAAISAALEPLLGTHGLGGAMRNISRIPEAVGLPFFMGSVLANLFETATGTPLRESIARQTRPSRLEWPQISRLLRQHEIDVATAQSQLENAGFQDADIALMTKLNRQLMSVTDLEILHQIGWMDDGLTRDYLDQLGFEPADRDAMLQVFAHRAATEGETSFRTIARNAYLTEYLSEDTYRGVLKEVETPPESIDLLVAGVKLERDAGRIHLSIAEIKDLYQYGHIDNNEVRQRLGKLGMNDADIADLLVVWSDGKQVARSGIGTAKILAYLTGGVIDKETAYARLILNGMNQKDAQFLVDNPTTHPITKTTPLKASTVVAAYKDDVLTIDEARAALESLKVAPEQIDLLLANATATVTKGKKPKKPTKTLSESQVIDALKFGLAEPTWAERELETLGWSPDDATLLVMIELTRLDPKAIQTYNWSVLT